MAIRASGRSVAVTVGAAGLAVTAMTAPVPTVEEGASDWARSLSEADRNNYVRDGSIEKLPVAYRRALFGATESAEERSEYWRSVLERFGATHVLTEEGVAAIAEMQTALGPEVFQSLYRPKAIDDRIRAARARLEAAVGADTTSQILDQAGAPAVAAAALPAVERMLFGLRAMATAHLVPFRQSVFPALEATTCNCNPNFTDDCTYFQRCASENECDVDQSWPACGTAWAHPCTKLCSYDS